MLQIAPETDWSSSPTIDHAFAQPGLYLVKVTVTNDSGQETDLDFYQAIHAPLTAQPPKTSMSIVYEERAGNDRVWNVNPDNNTVGVLDAVTNQKVAQITVGQEPRSLDRPVCS